MGNDPSRRKLIEITAVAAVSGLAGCSGGGDNNSSSNEGTEQDTGVIESVQYIHGEDFEPPKLEVSFETGEADRIAVQKDGQEIDWVNPSSTESVAMLSVEADELEETEYSIFATNQGEVIGEYTWTPEPVELSVADTEMSETYQGDFLITFEGTGEVPIEVTEAHISGGYPAEIERTTVLTTDVYETFWGSGNQVEVYFEGTLSDPYLLRTAEGNCDGETRQVEITLEFEDTSSKLVTLDVTPKGDRVEEDVPLCDETTIEPAGIETVDS